jgi:hypothetical protein
MAAITVNVVITVMAMTMATVAIMAAMVVAKELAAVTAA